MDHEPFLNRLLRRKAAKRGLAFTYKPSQPPTAFSADVHDSANAEAYKAATGKDYPSTAKIKPWKRWVGSEAEYDGAARGGLRDTLDADMRGVDQLKGELDSLKAATNQNTADIQALKEAPVARPFP